MMKAMLRWIFAGALLSGLGMLATGAWGATDQEQMAAAIEHGQVEAPTVRNAAHAANLAWFRQAKFGLFINWGPAVYSGGEMSFARIGERKGACAGTEEALPGVMPAEEYDKLYLKFKPQQFDPDAWIALAKEVGMKYVIFDAKHCDGFCLFDTAATDYSIMHGPYARDITAMVAEACHRADFPLGIYFSVSDWVDPDILTDRHDAFVQRVHTQVRELLSNYGPVRILWFDAPVTRDIDEPLTEMIYELQPGILVNDRGPVPGDFVTPELHIGAFDIARPWETCTVLGTHWIWYPDDEPKPLAECIRLLAMVAGRGGNLLLNVAPNPDGWFDASHVTRLREIGAWLDKYGQTIYDTTGGPWDLGPYAASTRRGRTAWVHVLNWRLPVVLRDVGVPIEAVELLTADGTVELTPVADGHELMVAPADRDELDTIVKVTFAASVDAVRPEPWDSGSLAKGKPATCSGTFPGYEGYATPAKTLDDDFEYGWISGRGDTGAWLAVDLERPQTFDRVFLVEGAAYRGVRGFVIEASDDGATWREVGHGTTIEDGCTVRFEPVTARHVRFRVTDTVENLWAIYINEFQVFAPGP